MAPFHLVKEMFLPSDSLVWCQTRVSDTKMTR